MFAYDRLLHYRTAPVLLPAALATAIQASGWLPARLMGVDSTPPALNACGGWRQRQLIVGAGQPVLAGSMCSGAQLHGAALGALRGPERACCTMLPPHIMLMSYVRRP